MAGQAALAWQQNRTVGGGMVDIALAQYTSQYNYIIYGIHMQSIYVFGKSMWNLFIQYFYIWIPVLLQMGKELSPSM